MPEINECLIPPAAGLNLRNSADIYEPPAELRSDSFDISEASSGKMDSK